MSFELSADLHPDLAPIAWMIGRWEGSGKARYPGTEDFDFGQQIDFAHNGGNYLHYLSSGQGKQDQGSFAGISEVPLHPKPGQPSMVMTGPLPLEWAQPQRPQG